MSIAKGGIFGGDFYSFRSPEFLESLERLKIDNFQIQRSRVRVDGEF